VTPIPEPSRREVEHFRTIVARRLGLHFDHGKLDFLAEVLRERVERLGAGHGPQAYLAGLESAAARDELRDLAKTLTVTETYFFRNAAQLTALRDLALPARVAATPAGRRLRILSAGCASGEEAHSLAILIRDLPATSGREVDIRAIDINVAMLDKAARGRYTAWSLRETPPEVRARCFRAEGRDFVLADDFRSMVTFEERNLAEPDAAFWQPEVFDVVFFRNVVMYFTPEVARAVIARIARSLVPGGFLFLGYAETLRGLSTAFHLRHTHETFYYQRREGSASPGDDWIDAVIESPPAHAPSAPAADDSWVETIRRASERIRALTAPPAPDAVPGSSADAPIVAAGKPVWDLGSAVELMRKEKFSEAGALLATLPTESAGDADVLLLRAVLLTHGGDLAAAEKLCAEVLARDEMSAGAHYLTALCREDAGDPRGAADHAQVATYLDPAFAMPRLHLGLLARRAGDHDAARRELKEALGLLQREDPSRLLLFAGGFSREALITLCRSELAACGGGRT
jgi:chemotaxis protein methyltransferase CheR